jgi:short-subunit dehydrogenase
MNTIAIFGAGPSLGMAVARKFGHEGFRVALVARDGGRLAGMAAELADEGIEADGFPADLTDRAASGATVDAIEARFGPVTVLEYSPTPGEDSPRALPSQIGAATVTPLLGKHVLTPVTLVQRILPGMLKRGEGTLLFALGASARYPMPRLAAGGMAGAALRSYAHALNAELAPRGVYAGTLVIGALISGSAAHRDAAAWSSDTGVTELPVVTAAELADRYWDMHLTRDRAEDEAG